MTNPSPMDDLIQMHLAGRMDAAAASALRDWLQADRGHRVAFMRAVRFHEELVQLATDQARRRSADPTDLRVGIGRPVRRRRTTNTAPASWRQRTLLFAAAIAALLLVTIGLWWRSGAGSAPALVATLLSGSAQGQVGVAVIAGTGLPAGYRLTMNEAGRLGWSDGSQIRLDPGSQIVCGDAGVTLLTGRLSAEVRPRPPGQPFSITTDQATVTVVGTRFSVAMIAEETVVEVASGHVRVRGRAGQERMLGPGETVRAGAGGLRGRTLAVAATDGPHGAGALASIAQALAAAQPGDTVLLEQGRHLAIPHANGNAALLITHGGEPGNPVILRGLPGAELVSDTWNAIRIEDAAWIELRSLRLVYQGSESSAMSGNGIAVIGGHHVTIADCDIIGFGGDGVNADRSDHLTISGNRITDCGGGRLGVMGGVTIRPATSTDDVPGYHTRVTGNRILRSTVNAPNHQTPDRWTGGNGITVFSDSPSPAAKRTLISDNLIAASGGSGISISASSVDIRANIIHGSGRQPKRAGSAVYLSAKNCSASGNLIVPSIGRLAWVLRGQDPLPRTGNLVWEYDGINRPDVLPEERLLTSPFLVPVADEAMRTDFRLRPDLHAGPPIE